MNTSVWSPEIAERGNRVAALLLTDAAELCEYLEQVHGVRVEFTSRAEAGIELATARFEVYFEGVAANRKIAAIKAVWQLTGWRLSEAKAFVEGAPAVFQSGLTAAKAAAVKAELEAAGACVSVRDANPWPCIVWLEEVTDPTKKILLIKLVREVTGVGLKEAKDLVEGCPAVLKVGLPRTEAEKLQTRLQAAGARATLR